MRHYSFFAFTGLVLGCCLSSCFVRSPRRWSVVQTGSPPRTEEPYIYIRVQRGELFLPIPPVLWITGVTKHYLFDMMVHTVPLDYQRLDSIRYEIKGKDQQILTRGTAPIYGGDFSFRAYDPTLYQAQAWTKPGLPLGKQRQHLTATLTLYLTDKQRTVRSLQLQDVALKYHKARLGSLF